jgi:L-malate glycosyltransferase
MLSFLFLDSEHVWRGGQDQLFTLLDGLQQRGHRVHLVCHPGSLLGERSRKIGIAVYPMAIRSDAGLISLFRLIGLQRRIRPDIVVFNTPRPIFVGNLASRFSSAKVRIIFRRVNFPIRDGLWTRLKYTWGIDAIIAISESIGLQLVSGGVPRRLIRIVYEGLDLAHFPKRTSPKTLVPGEPVTVGTVAHLSPEKGIRYLVEAAREIPGVHSRMRFVLVGDGECRQDLEKRVRGAGLEHCFDFCGFQHDTVRHLQRFDIFVLPSLSEGLSSAILAAMAMSLPVVATEVGGIPELVRPELTGLLVASANAEALAAAIQRLAADPDERFRMGQQGRARVEQYFTLERKIVETENLCLELVSGKGQRTKGKRTES